MRHLRMKLICWRARPSLKQQHPLRIERDIAVDVIFCCVFNGAFSALPALPLSRRRTHAHVSSFIRRLSTRCRYLRIALSSVFVRSCLSLPRTRCSLRGNRSKHHHGPFRAFSAPSPAVFSFFGFRFPPARAWTQPVI